MRAWSRRVIAVGTTALLGTFAVATGGGQAVGATSHVPAPTAPSLAARQVGIYALGQAYMGWSQHRPTQVVATPWSASPWGARANPPRRFDPPWRHKPITPTSSGREYGIDVSSHQGNVNWPSVRAAGNRFAYVKASEGSYYTSPYYSSQYTGSAAAGLIRGAYHFANPSYSSGTTQASYFVAHGGGWKKDGKTLPGVLDIEYNPYGSECYGLTASQMVSWVKAFTTKYTSLTGRDAIIYSTTDWWTTCTGNSSAFASTNPLWIARYATSVGTLPHGWLYYTFWQYSGSQPADKDIFNSSLQRLQALANG